MKKNRLSAKSILLLSFNSISTKPIRFVITILLFVFCLSIIATANSASSLDTSLAHLKAYNDTGETSFILGKSISPSSRIEDEKADLFTLEQAAKVETELNYFNFTKLYKKYARIKELVTLSQLRYYAQSISGFVIAEDVIDQYDMRLLAGRMPLSINETVIPYYLYQSFAQYGYYQNGVTPIAISKYDDLIGKQINISSVNNLRNNLNIVGIVDTKLDEEKYKLLKEDESTLSDDDYYIAKNSNILMYSFISNSYHSAYFVTEEFINEYICKTQAMAKINFELYGKLDRLARSVEFLVQSNNTIKWYKDNHVLTSDEIIITKADVKGYFSSSIDPFVTVTDEMIEELFSIGFEIRTSLYNIDQPENESAYKSYRVVGYYEPIDETSNNSVLLSQDNLTPYQKQDDRLVAAMFTKLSGDKNKDINLIRFSTEPIDDNYIYRSYSIFNVDIEDMSAISITLRKIGIPASIAFSVFAALMMFNFISATIIAKRKEIGILRALGANNKATLGIFLSESVIVAIISAILSFGGSIGLIALLNSLIEYIAYDFKLLVFGWKQGLIITFVGLLISVIGSVIPIIKLVRKKPMEIIRE